MLDKILKVLKEKNIEQYRINDNTVESSELFFVKKSLDTRRIENYRTVQVTVFREFEKAGKQFLGNANCAIEPSMTEQVIAERIGKAYEAAAFVPNLPFPQAEKRVGEIETVPSKLADMPAAEAVTLATEALFRNDTDSNTFINSAEIFVTKTTSHILNSNGLDVGYVKYGLKGEYVCQCVSPENVETYAEIGPYDDMECDQLAEAVKKTLELTRDRAVAQPNKTSGKVNILLSDKYASRVLAYYMEITANVYTYLKYFEKQPGDFVQGEKEKVKGDFITYDMLPTVPYSDEGIYMERIPGVENGVLKNLWGGLRYSHYLGMKPTGDFGKCDMKEGSVSFEDMKKEPGLYVVNFSDFQMDAITGHFRGEIRLAYYNDGNTIVPVTGGSVNGDIRECEKNFVLSKERQNTLSFAGPKAILLRDVAVAGV